MRFELNIYRLGRERHREAMARARSLGIIILFSGLSLAMLVIYSQAVWSTVKGLDVAQARLEGVEQAFEAATAEGAGLTSDELMLLKDRAAQVPWSSVLRRVGELAPSDTWYMRLSLIEGSALNEAGQEGTFHIFGIVKAKGRDESVTELMSFVDTLRADPELSQYFQDAKLVTMRWEGDIDNAVLEGLSFEAVLSLQGPIESEVDYDEA
jgi:hypothetical protein